MSSFFGFGDVAKCAKLAFKLYEYGFKSIHNACTQYVEFGQAVHALHSNLIQLQGVFESVKKTVRGPIPGNSSFYDTTALNSILDEPFVTIEECQQLLTRRDSFAEVGGVIRNIYWNTFIEAEVALLHKKVMFHNTKILALLKPLELKLLLDTQSLVTHYGEAILRELERQNVKLFGDGQVVADQEVVRCDQVIIPPYLIRRFEELSKDARPESQANDTFPMHDGINAFLQHYQDDAAAATFSRGFLLSSPSQSLEQYVGMMKSIWIIQRIQRSTEYIVSCQRGNRLLKCFVEDLAQKSLDVFNRYSDQPENPYKVKNEPSEASLASIGEDVFMIWPKAVQSYDHFDVAAIDTMKTILRAPLSHLNPERQKALLLLQQSDAVLEMITKETSESERFSESRSRDIDLRVVSLNPIYADPQSQTSGIDVGLYTLGTRGRDDLLSFLSYNDLYCFQEAITGFRVVDDLVNVDVIVMTDKPTIYTARIQIWDFARNSGTKNTSPTGSRRASLAPSMATIRAPTQSNNSMKTIRRPSDPPSHKRFSTARTFSSKQPTLSTSPKSYSSEWSLTSSARSATTTLSDITSLSDPRNSDIEAFLFDVLLEPLIVLFLRPKPGKSTSSYNPYSKSGGNSGGLTLLKIPIGERSAVLERGNCSCQTGSASCTHSCISGVPKKMFGVKPLLAERWGGTMVNLAALGAHYGEGRGGGEKEKLSHVQMTFCAERGKENEKFERKKRFEQSVAGLQRVHEIRKDDHERAKVDLKFKNRR